MPEIHIENLKQYQDLIKSDVAVVRFTASWCGPCRRIAPDFQALSNIDYRAKANFMTIDIDKAELDSDLKHLLKNVSSIPTFHFYKDGEVVDTLTGSNLTVLKQKLNALTQEVSKEQESQKKEASKTENKEASESKTNEEASESKNNEEASESKNNEEASESKNNEEAEESNSENKNEKDS